MTSRPSLKQTIAGGGAYRVDLDDNWRLFVTYSADESDVLVGHVFKSNHKKEGRNKKDYKRLDGHGAKTEDYEVQKLPGSATE